MTDKELQILFEKKLAEWNIPFNEANWEAFTQMSDPAEPMSEQEFRKLYKDKITEASFQFNPSAWEALEEELGPEGGMSDEEMRNLFENKVSPSAFAFNKQNWNRMEHLLEEQERSPFAFYWRSMAAVFVMALGSLLFLQSDNGGLIEQNVKPVSSTIPKIEQEPLSQELQAEESLENITNTVVVPASPANSENQASLPPQTYIAQTTSNDGSQEVISTIQTQEHSTVPAVAGNPYSWTPFASISASNFALRPFEIAEVSAPAPVEPYIPATFSKIYALGGPNINPGFNGSMGAGFQAGLVYEYGINKVSSLELGVIYNQSAIGLETMSDSTFFGLGRTDVNTHRHYKNLGTLRVPLSYRFNFMDKHSISAGAYVDVLIQVAMDETVTTTIFKQNPKVEERSYRQAMKSFESFTYGASLSYNYQYSERMSMGLSYNLTLSDITNNHAIGFEGNHRPEQISLQLKYRIFER